MKVKDPAMIRRWRKQEHLSQAQLGYLVRRSQTTIYLLETGGMRTLSEDLALAIAARLRVPWEDLFEAQEHEVMPEVTNDAHSTRRTIRPHHNRRMSA
ncbi:helix-turn-helix transcriptional regulator [Paenarthrobacter nitroguajacolicus]|uniref:helix-turn-helix transcriptional regulator n=1 Tax=Paenarthrobacter nitroguajacolicus TaxID=211146 RepID=UPI0015BB3B3E|nr:helix-turn-helix transcriptional regulator [Paenarthrobacter nitroguajacolicus]NWL32947.1 XRE family transcriptional regulator [Paenarthrobacter nitroguajacolicus]